jgi:hypothetical protein
VQHAFPLLTVEYAGKGYHAAVWLRERGLAQELVADARRERTEHEPVSLSP